MSAEAAATVRARAGGEDVALAIVLGTGLGPLADDIADAVAIAYGDLAGFPASGVSGHAGRLVVGSLEGLRVAVLQGREHYYEHGRADAMRAPLETVKAIGATTVLLTNSAGSLRPQVGPGRPMLITDHIAFTGLNPLIGEADDARFVDLSQAYDPELRDRLKGAAAAAGLALAEGVYCWFSGPSFETPAEIRAARVLGADAVGMSTVPEVILARRLGLRVAALSMITNLAAGLGGALSHGETKSVAAEGGKAMGALVRGFAAGLARGGS
jgi:purine-nucleoside phosphorylase